MATLPNLVAVPLTGLFLPAVLFSLPGETIGVGSLFADSARLLGHVIGGALRVGADHLPFWSGLSSPSPWAVGAVFLLPWVWFAAPRPVRKQHRVRGAAAALALGMAMLCFLKQEGLPGPWVAFLDVGQGDAAVCRLSDGTIWVIDVGDDRGPGDAARNVVLPFLRSQGIRRVDGLVLSHRHRDHVGALQSFLEGISVRFVFDAGYGGRGGTSGRVDSLLAAHRLWPCLVAAGDTLYADRAVSLVALHPPRGDPTGPPPGDNLNNASLMILVEDADLCVFFAGDGEKAAEESVLRGQPRRTADILKVGHHGSETSTKGEFLDCVKPTWGVLSCGVANRYGHPSPATVTRLLEHRVRVIRTDQDGTAWFRVDGNRELVLTTFPPR